MQRHKWTLLGGLVLAGWLMACGHAKTVDDGSKKDDAKKGEAAKKEAGAGASDAGTKAGASTTGPTPAGQLKKEDMAPIPTQQEAKEIKEAVKAGEPPPKVVGVTKGSGDKKERSEEAKNVPVPLSTHPSGLRRPGGEEKLVQALEDQGVLSGRPGSKVSETQISAAIRRFQHSQSLAATGFAYDATLKRLGLKPEDINLKRGEKLKTTKSRRAHKVAPAGE